MTPADRSPKPKRSRGRARGRDPVYTVFALTPRPRARRHGWLPHRAHRTAPTNPLPSAGHTPQNRSPAAYTARRGDDPNVLPRSCDPADPSPLSRRHHRPSMLGPHEPRANTRPARPAAREPRAASRVATGGADDRAAPSPSNLLPPPAACGARPKSRSFSPRDHDRMHVRTRPTIQAGAPRHIITRSHLPISLDARLGVSTSPPTRPALAYVLRRRFRTLSASGDPISPRRSELQLGVTHTGAENRARAPSKPGRMETRATPEVSSRGVAAASTTRPP
jgi:hypothetical protein